MCPESAAGLCPVSPSELVSSVAPEKDKLFTSEDPMASPVEVSCVSGQCALE